MDNSPNTQKNNQQNQRERVRNTHQKVENKGNLITQGRAPNKDRNSVVRSENKRMDSGPNSTKGRDNYRHSNKPRGSKAPVINPQDTKSVDKAKQTVRSDNNPKPVNRPRYGKNTGRASGRNETKPRNIRTRQFETVEDIQADIERIDKDIQFEIKQISTIKLGL